MARVTLKVIVVLVVILVIAGLTFRLMLPGIVLEKVRGALGEQLVPESSLADIELDLSDGTFTVSAFAVDQPEGFGKGRSVIVPFVFVDIDESTLFKPNLVIDEVVVRDAAVTVVRNARGLNVARLTAEKADKEEEEKARTVHIRRISIQNMQVTYTDTGLEKGVLTLRTAYLDADISDLRIGGEETGQKPAHLVLQGVMTQAPFQDAPLGITAEVGGLGQKVTPINAALRLVGLEMNPYGPFLPTGTTKIIGGDALDLSVNLSMGPEFLDGKVWVDTVGGYTHEVKMGGTLQNPTIDTGEMMGKVAERAGGVLQKTAEKVGGAGGEVAGGVAGTAAAIGKGAKDTAKTFVGGLFSTVKGVATGDVKEVKEGLKEGTVGTVKSAGEAVVGTGKEIMGGVADVASSGEVGEKWRSQQSERWREKWQQAQQWVEEAAFPPAAGPPSAPEEDKPDSGEAASEDGEEE